MPAKITDPNKLKELQDNRLTLVNQLQAYHTEHEKTWTAENETAFQKLDADYDAVYGQIEDHQKACDAEAASEEAATKRQERLNSLQGHGSRLSQSQQNRMKSGGGDDRRDGRDGKMTDGPLKGFSQSAIGALAFAAWLSGRRDDVASAACKSLGFNPESREIDIQILDTGSLQVIQNAVASGQKDQIQNALGTGSGTVGGYTFGESFVNSLEVAMVAASGILEAAQVIRTTDGTPMRWPTVNDTANKGRQIGESQAVASLDPTFGQKVWYAHKFTSDEILVPSELLRDNAVGLEQLLPDLLGLRLARIINEKGTTGSGANTMTGIVTASVEGKGAASATAITFDEVIDLEHSVNRALRGPGAAYMFNDTTLKLLRKLKDGDSRYLWQAGANTGAPDVLNNRPYIINDDMADPATTAKTMLFGKLSNYKLRMVRKIRLYRLVERHRENDQDAFLAFIEADGNLLNAGDDPVKHLVQA